ncbi:MAG: tripartite tricarboxylate transporter TctB family protein [Pseudomonadota bacterium]
MSETNAPVADAAAGDQPDGHSQCRRRPGEGVFLLVALGFAGWALVEAYGIAGFTSLSSPGVFPMLAAASMVASSLFVLLDVRRRPPAGASGWAIAAQFVRHVVPTRHVVVLALIVAYLVAMPALGFLASSAAFLLLAFLYLWRRPWWQALLLTITLTVAVQVVFRVVFQVVLPTGSLGLTLPGLSF